MSHGWHQFWLNLSGWGALAGCVMLLGSPAPAANATNESAGLSQLPGLPELNPMASRSNQLLVASSVEAGPNESESTQRAVLRQKLDLAQQQHRDRQFDQAEQNLSFVLAAHAAPDLERSALLEMAELARDTGALLRAQQVYGQFVQQFRDDPQVPEVLLSQGLLYREMGAPMLALSKFYSVMSSALTLKVDRLAYYQRLVLQAQTEIAQTYFLEGRFIEAADFFNRLLRLDSPDLNREQVLYQLTRCWSAAGCYPEALAQARLFLARFATSSHVPEVRFIVAGALKHLGRSREAVQEVLELLQAQHAVAEKDQASWSYWQQRAGNELANQLYESGDYFEALEIYLRLADVNPAPQWRLPAWYEAGLIYERLKQPDRARELYQLIESGGKEFTTNQPPSASMTLVLQMAQWRGELLAWQSRAESVNQQLSRSAVSTNSSGLKERAAK